MRQNRCMNIKHQLGRTHLVLDSPHSGVDYPADFKHSADLVALRRAEDTHVDKLYDFAPALGVGWVEALFPRSYLDANRHPSEIDVSMIDGVWTGPVATNGVFLNKIKIGKGLIWRTTDDNAPIYQRQLSVAEVQARLQHCWQPYHDAVAQTIDAAHSRHGYNIHVNCHSMPAFASSEGMGQPGEAYADFVIGDRDGTTANPALSRLVCRHLEGCGYSVSYNYPYKGVELVRCYSNPAEHRHSIQVEINRKLYMNEDTRELIPNAMVLKTHLRSLVDLLLATDPSAL